MEQQLKSSAINYGVYLGLTLALISVLIYVINVEYATAWWIGIIMLLLILGFGIVSTAKSKDFLNGFISFKQAFSSFFITVAIGVIISTGVGIIIYGIIDTEAAALLQEKGIENTVSMMERFGAPQSEIDKTIDAMSEENSFSVVNQLKAIAYQLVFYAVIGLIVAAFMKKKNPDLA
jgi:c-di-AMP phosphodiesterase-like protein